MLGGHTGDVRAVCFAGDNIITGSRDCTARLWQCTGPSAFECTHTYTGHSRYVMAVAWTPPSARFPNGCGIAVFPTLRV
ncbi:hypothetical protein, partial [Streptococcus pneumoniae]|uniref:hypothetical protein n=1 Tax=Streptococcus pneumoniae TaxID=1313 RepID=UPI00139E6F15|nr:hypothetical protein [Streptococcus pneumoniae]